MKKYHASALISATLLLFSCEQNTNDSNDIAKPSKAANQTYPCTSRGGENAEAFVNVGQEYFDFEQTKNANYFSSTSPKDAARDFASMYCSANPTPGWFTGPVINGRGPDGRLVTRHFDEVTCQANLSTVPTPIPVTDGNNGQRIYYSGCKFDLIGNPADVGPADTGTTAPIATPTPI